jgi:hypothetical protein
LKWLAGANGSLGRPRAELALLVLASLCVVLALAIAVSDARAMAPAGWRTFVLMLSVAAGGTVLAAAMAVTAALRRGGRTGGSADDIVELRKNLLTAESIIKAEPQVLVFWEQGQGVRVMVHTLAGVAGLPAARRALKFGTWPTPHRLASPGKGLVAIGRRQAVQPAPEGRRRLRGGRRAGWRQTILWLRGTAASAIYRDPDQHRLLVRNTHLAGRCSTRCRCRCGSAARTAPSSGSTRPT